MDKRILKRIKLPVLEEKLFKFIMLSSSIIVLSGLLAILITILVKGLPALNLDMLTKTPSGGYYVGKSGGILNAIAGSLVLGISSTFLAFILSLPIVIYLNLYLKTGSRLAFYVRFALDVLWGIPSIVFGAFGFTLMVIFGLKMSLLAGVITVALLVLPIMARSMDEILKMIPLELKEAAYSLGSTRLETAFKVIVKQALPGIMTAALMAFGRAIGDAASVLFTAGFTDSLPTSIFKPVATLPLAIFFQLGTPFPEVQARGYASALILTVIIVVVCLLARMFSKKYSANINQG